ncbi:YjbH domain-containing protein [Sagittula sp. NFXS13]
MYAGVSLAVLATMPLGSFAQDVTSRNATSLNLYGSPGLVDMPTAEVLPDATIAATFGRLGDTSRTTIYFQATPRLSGSFRYTSLPSSIDGQGDYFDRSFDLRYQLVTEDRYRPSVVLGFSDVIGTGVYSGEYLVATKTVAPGMKVTGGLGWGRFGGRDPIGSSGSRPNETLERGGIPTYDRWFRGDIAPFGGISYAPNNRLKLKLEYSSDLYTKEVRRGWSEKPSSAVNYGLDYKFSDGDGQISLYHVLGEEVGAQLTFLLNPRTSGVPGGMEPSGVPVAPREAGAAADLGWTRESTRSTQARTQLAGLLKTEGMQLEGMTLESRRAIVRISNGKYQNEAQAIGRVARAMTRTLPASVETFEIIPVVDGMPTAAVVLGRSDLERLEHEPAADLLPRAQFVDAKDRTPAVAPGVYPKFSWSLGPTVNFSLFDPNSPVRANLDLRASATYSITPGLQLSGSVTQKLTGNLDKVSRRDESGLPRVRTDRPLYVAEGDQTIERLQLAHYGRPARDFYSRVSVGYLEEMYGGASAELLWKPVDSRLALGAEVNYIQKRDYDQLFGFQDMTTTDPVSGIARDIPEVNGHVSAYYAFDNGFHGQLDVGRYLAGDVGATVSVDREFANGWRVGAYATITDASAEDFGEGSFDKGIRFTIPIGSLIGIPTRRENTVTIQSLTRDGGARLDVQGRLYEKVRDYHQPDVANTWGTFWR